jgi:hypothetical protein
VTEYTFDLWLSDRLHEERTVRAHSVAEAWLRLGPGDDVWRVALIKSVGPKGIAYYAKEPQT